MTDDKAFSFLTEYLNNASPTGFESSGQQLWLDYLRPYVDETFTDPYGTAVGIINPGTDYRVVIEAHADEISWFVNYIDDKGYIYVRRNGGSDHMIAPSQRVNLHTEKGIVQGVFGWPAIHVRRPDKEKVPAVEGLFIDVGASKKEEVLEMGIYPGTVATFVDGFMTLNDKYWVGRALDNRIGGFMIAQVARALKEGGHSLPFSLYVVNSVQEEIGLRGAQMIAHRIKPQLALVTDVCHDTQSPMYDKKVSGDQTAGEGPVLTYGPAVHNNVIGRLVETAEKHEIAIQRASATRMTGTDTDAFAYSNEGVPSALVSLALKYMHTTVETVHKDDVQAIVDLFTHFLLELPANHDFSYLK